MEKNLQENKMGTMPIGKLIISMSLPMMISMLVQALYNIVDSIFVARICEDALTAVSLAFPVQHLMISAASGIAVGVNAFLSKFLGEKKPAEASSVARNGIFLSILIFAVFAIIGIFLSRTFFALQTSDAEIIEYGTTYMMICLVFSLGIFMQIIFERLLMSTGKTMFSMYSQLSGAIVNIIFDPIFIFGWFGIPAMGVAGAAIATVLGQHVACIVGLILNLKCNREISINMKKFRPDGRMIKNICSVGIPSIIMMSIGSVTTFLMNKILLVFSSTAVAVFGVYFKLQSFVFMPLFGLNSGMVPVIAYNYGARSKKRIMKTIKLCIIYATTIMLTGIAIMQLFPTQLFSLFDASENMLQIGIPALRIISISFIFAGYCIIVGSVFQALGDGIKSMIVSIIRQIVVLIPVAFLLARTGNVDNVWWSYPIAEIFSMIFTTVFLKMVYNNKIKNIES